MKSTNKPAQSIVENLYTQQVNDGLKKLKISSIEEKWDSKKKIKKLDKYGKEKKSIAQLKTRRNTLKKKKERSAKESKELKQINFAIRSRGGWNKKISENATPLLEYQSEYDDYTVHFGLDDTAIITDQGQEIEIDMMDADRLSNLGLIVACPDCGPNTYQVAPGYNLEDVANSI
jgi:hypothetical protein